MVASVSASAPAGDAPVRFPDTRAARQPQLEKKREGAGEENANSNLLQARPLAAWLRPSTPLCSQMCLRRTYSLATRQVVVIATYLAVKWTWSWLQSRKPKAEAEE